MTVIHRLFESGSDRSSLVLRESTSLTGTEKIDLQHLYRAMGFLGESHKDQTLKTRFAPRCNKDVIEELLFENRYDLFTKLDIKQIVVGVVMDENGIPLCCEIWPGMISKEVTDFLESPNNSFSYILGVRLRLVKEVREQVLTAEGDYQEIKPMTSRHSPLKVKEVVYNKRRYVICFNEVQARKDAYDREAIINSLKDKLKHGDKSLVGNKGYKKYLKTSGKKHFEIDEEKIRSDELFDGKWVLTSNTNISPIDLAKQYKQLWMVENFFRTMKSVLETRPIFHKVDYTIRGHVFCSFLVILLRRELERRLEANGYDFQWNEILNHLGSVEELTADISDKRVLFRRELKGCAGKIFQSVGVAIPPTVRFIN